MAGELISRAALERIVQRAAELQTGEHDIGEGLTEEELLALGKDVGIPARYLRQALVEERTRALDEVPRKVRSLAGPAFLTANRVVPGDRAAIEGALTLWMENEELLRVKRRYPDRTTWEPQIGFLVSMQRGLRAGGRPYVLAHAAEIAAQVTPLEAGFCHVRLTADVRNLRRARLGGAAGLAGAGLLGTGAAAAAGIILPFVAFPMVGFGLAALAVLIFAHSERLEKLQVGLEQVLDRLEHGEIRPEHALPGPRLSAFGRIADEIRKQFQLR
jgi:hypothetical protein